jgi:acyl-CoA thioesterase-1
VRRASAKARGGFVAAVLLCAATLPAAAQGADAPDEDRIVIAALGDSLTAGYGLAPGEGFVPQLQAWLEARGMAVDLRNAGVSGDTTAGGLARIDWTLTPDVDALIVTLGGNDLLRGLPPEAARANLEGIVSRAAERGVDVLLVGMQASGNFGQEYKRAFDAMYPELAQTYGTLYAESFFAGLAEDGAQPSPAGMARFMQGDGIHPNAQGVARIVAALGPSVAALAERAAQEGS